MTTTFFQLPVGARFEFRGRRYEKVALSMADDEERRGSVFPDHVEVAWDKRPGEESRPPRPAEPYWTEYLCTAPGQVRTE